MKSLSLLLVVALVAPAFAQEDLKDELNQEISVLYPKTTLKKRVKAQKVASRQDLDLEDSNRSVIINNNVSAPNSDSTVREQPSTVVEASPVDVSKAAESRRSREQMEKSTEDKIVQQLEKDRINAEQERSKKAEDIFSREQQQKVEVAPVAPVAPIAVQEVAPVYVAPVVQQTSSAQLVEVEKTKDVKEEQSKMYIGALGGMGDYSTAKNVDGKAAAGVIFGMEFPEGFLLEANLIFSQYDVQESQCLNTLYGSPYGCGYYGDTTLRMTQTNLTIAGKYAFLGGRVRPVVGGLLGYTSRNFENKNTYNYNPYYNNTNSRQQYPSSWAIDGGISAGADIKLSEKFHIGADLRYMMNLTYDREENPVLRYYSNTTAIEELSYYMFSVNATFRF